MNTTDKVIDKIRKLFALAERNNSPEEAASAAARAQELLFQHKLSMADVEAPDEAEDVLGSLDFDAPGLLWKKHIVHGVARAFYCRACTLAGSNKHKVRIVGKTSDTQAATYMAAYLINEIDHLAKVTQAQWKDRRWMNSFRIGATHIVLKRLNEQKKAQDAYVAAAPGETALALRNDAVAVARYFKQLFPRTTTGGRSRATSNSGYEAGQEAGRNISLGGGKGLAPEARRLTSGGAS